MDELPPSIPNTSSGAQSNTFLSINRPDSTSSNSPSTTRETSSRNSNSTSNSHSPALGSLEGMPVSAASRSPLPPHLRNRILANTPGTPAFVAANQVGGVHPARATQAGRPAATIEAAAQRRNPQPNVVPFMQIQNPAVAQLLAQSRFQQRPYFFPSKTVPKRTA